MADAASPPPVPPDALDAPDAPSVSPLTWDSVGIGGMTFPPIPGEGAVARVSFTTKIKVDKQKASGKDKAKTKVNGVEPAEGELELTWTPAVDEAAMQFTMALDPNGPNAGKPFDIVHPEAQRRRVKSILVVEAGKLEIKHGGHLLSQKFKIEEWVDPGDADKDSAAADTPDASTQWTSTKGDGSPRQPWSTTYGEGTPQGQNKTWSGAGAPNAAP